MISKHIAEIESELRIVRDFFHSDEEALSSSVDSLANKIFFTSSQKRKLDLEKQLFIAKSERAHELFSLRLIGNQMTGTISLKSLVKITEPLNTFLEQSAWRFWDKDGKGEKIDDNFSSLIDLRLAGIESGSTELLILGNTSPDLAGDSALEGGLKNIFNLLASGNDEFADSVHLIGINACRSLSRLMETINRQSLAAEFFWAGPEKNYEWSGKPSEITRIKAILDEIGEPIVETEMLVGIVQVLSVRNKMEIFCPQLDKKININYHRSQFGDVNELHLGDRKNFLIEKTTYPFRISNKKRNVYTLKSIHSIE